jgi:hypothetical protein
VAGTLLSQAGNSGIAYLRFDRATGEMTAGGAKVTRKDTGKIPETDTDFHSAQ